MQPETLAGLLSHLGRAGEPEGACSGLTSAQLSALRYLARANPMSRTASALAAYQGTTRGTVSQTVKALVQAGYVTRTPSDADRRTVRLDLTQAGWAKLEQAPNDRLVAAVARLPQHQRAVLADAAMSLNGALSAQDSECGFGTCETCKHREDTDDAQADYCCHSGCALGSGDQDCLCASYRPRFDLAAALPTTSGRAT
ncbi:MarR family winged helix-turn-helix transcriptional regulator [Rhodovibrio salinarum]|uniref:MarR family transcriptional regulator n=1 Tax=Rhodovibrio salinarum TaxID=1087 RepID=A0A934QHJ5_9PROT|nr:MarR family transcriptional regulator [Rhodovibrio salinarum]MBK1696645.1 MarR family transcriptional regulator [Rhodovibrio salinarum]